jgi:hydrogenase expression/formation protein HypE
MTKGAGIEGTAILATDFADEADVDQSVIDEAAGYFDEISVIPDARAVRESATAMHDPTEGGLVDGLLELAGAAGVDLRVAREAVPVRPPTRALCDAMGVDPVRGERRHERARPARRPRLQSVGRRTPAGDTQSDGNDQ